LGVLGPEVAEIYAALHTEHGVELRMGVEVAEIIGADRRASGVRLADGSQIEADVVVVGVGITPNTELAEAAGLTVDNGIVVGEHLGSADPDVFAAGDVANAYYASLGCHLRLEHWSAALNQGPVAAANMVGRTTAYDHVPYFFSDQYDMGMEYRGYVEPGAYDQVVFRGEVATGEYFAFWLRDDRVLAAMNVNIWDAGDSITALVRSGVRVDPARLADPDVALEDLHADSASGAA
jgi:3-phenylpropionate/trans-cinnamate dioxygenase ferredoxin reductase subunit